MLLGPPPFRVRLNYRRTPLPHGIRANIDTPVHLTIEQGLVVEVAGWVAHFGAESSAPHSVVLSVGKFGWLEVPIELNRPDVVHGQLAETGHEPVTARCGFSLLLPAHLVRAGGPYTLSLKLADGAIVHGFAEIGFESIASDTWRIPTSVQPLVLNSVGRTGSSLLCRMLSEHVAMHVPRSANQYGEIAVCGYACRMLAVLSSTGSHEALNRVGDLPDFHRLEPPHFASRMLRLEGVEEFQHGHVVRSLTGGAHQLAVRVLTDYIAFVRAGRPSLRYLVEKSWNSYNMNVLELLFGGNKEVFVVREASEFLESQKAFLKKEGANQDHIERQHRAAAHRLGNLARAWNDRKGNAHLVKYEHLIADPTGVLGDLCDYLGLYRAPTFISTASAMVSEDTAHAQMLRTHRSGDSHREFSAYLSSLDSDQRSSVTTYIEEFGY